jgi:hypothetical protein
LAPHGSRMWTPLLEIPTDRLVVFAVAVGKPLQAPAKQVKPLCFGLLLLSQATLVKTGSSQLSMVEQPPDWAC